MKEKLSPEFERFKSYAEGTFGPRTLNDKTFNNQEVENLLEMIVTAIETGTPVKEVKKVLYPYISAWHEDTSYG